MISKKVFDADGSNTRFLSDFIIQSEQFCRVYVYIYDNTLNPDGTQDQLQNGSTNQADFVFPTNIWKRGADAPDSGDDLLTIDKWDLVTNSILTYDVPLAPTKIWIEVATTPEEFGSTLTQPSVERAEVAADEAQANAILTAADVVTTNANVVLTHADVVLTHEDVVLTNADAAATAADKIATNADVVLTHADADSTNADVVLTHADVVLTHADVESTNADVDSTNADVVLTHADVVSTQLLEWEAEAERLTSESYAVEPEDVFVKVYTSDGDGTFTATATTSYSALHHQTKGLAQDASTKLPKDGSEPMSGNLEAPSVSIGGDFVSPYGMKNKLINGDKRVNQREYADGVLADGDYGYDRWKGHSLDVNIEQVIEQQNIRSGTYTISWVGGGTATVNGTSGLSSGDSLSITVISDISVIVPKASTDIQLEEGSVATPFEHRPVGLEKSLCHRYYWTGFSNGKGLGEKYTIASGSSEGGGASFPTTMRVIPSMTVSGTIFSNCTTLDLSATVDGFTHRVSVSTTALYRAYNGIYTADAEL